MIWPKGKHLAYNSTNFPNLSIIFPIFFHNILNVIWITPSFNYKYHLMYVHTSHQPYGYWLLTFCSWQQMHKYSWCNLWHLCYHRARCWLSRGMKTTTCNSFNHVQLFLSISWHYVHQRWHLYPNWCCHCQPNASKFTSLILRNSRICCFWCGSKQKKEPSWPTTH